MNMKQTSGFIWGIVGNIVASLFIALANILIGRFIPNAPQKVIDVSSLVLPLLIIFMFLYRDRIGKIRIAPCSWFLKIRELLTQAPQMEQIRQLFRGSISSVYKFVLQLFKTDHKTKNWTNYLEKAIKPSVIIVTLVTVFLIVGFGVSIRWLFEQRIVTTIPSLNSSYRQVYDFLAPK